MVQTSATGIRVRSVSQVGIVVKNVEEVVENYWNLLGIGPWTILTSKSPYSYDMTYHGRSAPHEFKVALTQVGPLELELMETIQGPTAYNDFIAKHGEGIHHLQYQVDSVEVIDKHVETLAKRGFPSLGGGRFGSDGGWSYTDTTSALKAIWEPAKTANEFDVPKDIYPAYPSAVSPAKIKCKAITRIGLVVNNLEEVMENYRNLLGIGSWEVCDVKPPEYYDLKYYGKPTVYTGRASFVQLGPVQLELIQPLSGVNIYSDFIRDNGEGLHHFVFEVNDINETSRIIEQEGFPITMGGKFRDGGFAYYGTSGPLKAIFEGRQLPTTQQPTHRWPTIPDRN